MQQLLFIEAIVKGAIGLVLLSIPGVVTKLLGLPQTPTGVWPRLLGATLIGIAIACVVEGAITGARGLAMGGVLAINFALASVMTIQLATNAAAETVRGRVLLWILVASLYVLILVEIAHV